MSDDLKSIRLSFQYIRYRVAVFSWLRQYRRNDTVSTYLGGAMERNSSDVKNENRPARKPAGAAVLQDSVTAAIHRALFEEWAETGYAALRMERIAVRAKVGKAALYRRSKSKLELVTEAIRSTATNITPILDSGSFEGDIEAFIRRLAATLRHPIVRRILPDLHAENARSDELSDLLDRVTQDRR
ncbi:MAG: TetR/AcrR family transcriptional regulator, partial [Roseovarius sp.]